MASANGNLDLDFPPLGLWLQCLVQEEKLEGSYAVLQHHMDKNEVSHAVTGKVLSLNLTPHSVTQGIKCRHFFFFCIFVHLFKIHSYRQELVINDHTLIRKTKFNESWKRTSISSQLLLTIQNYLSHLIKIVHSIINLLKLTLLQLFQDEIIIKII